MSVASIIALLTGPDKARTQSWKIQMAVNSSENARILIIWMGLYNIQLTEI
jgi:hypothetical protein